MAHDIAIVSEDQLRALVGLDTSMIDLTERAFVALAKGGVIMPPIMSMELHDSNGELDAKTAYLPGFDSFALKVSTGFYGNAALGLPNLNGLRVLFSAKTGMVEAVLLDNGYLTDLRTAAAGAVAARHLAPETVDTAGVIGTGMQALMQIEAAHLVRPFSRVLVHGRDMDKARACADDLARTLGIEATAIDDAQTLVRDSQLVVTATASRAPVIDADWLHPGLHITALGSDADYKNEIDPRALARTDAYICDRVSQCEVLGELRSALAAGLWTKGTPAELGEVVIGTKTGRRAQSDITICDLTGTGAQDTAIATHAYALFKQGMH